MAFSNRRYGNFNCGCHPYGGQGYYGGQGSYGNFNPGYGGGCGNYGGHGGYGGGYGNYGGHGGYGCQPNYYPTPYGQGNFGGRW